MQTGTAWQPPVAVRTLNELPSGAHGVVRGLCGGKEFIGRVAALGFTVGTEVSVVRNYGRGPLIVEVRDTRVALGRGEAAKIQVDVRREA